MAEKATKKEKKVEGLNLSTVSTVEKSNMGVEMEIIHPGTGEPTGAFLTVCGEDSELHATAMNIVSRRRIKAQRRSGQVTIDNDDIQHGLMTIAIHCVTGWRGVLDDDGQPLPFSRAELRRVLTDYKFILEDVNAFIGDRANFLPD